MMKKKDVIQARLPAGIRRNNPGNLRYSEGNQWLGLDEPKFESGFCCFATPAMGIRAMCRTLLTYQDKRTAEDGSKIDTVREIIERWAPNAENDTDAYISFVRKEAGVRPGQFIDLHEPKTMRAVVKSIIHYENGSMPYTEAQVTKGMMLAGVEDAQRPLNKSRTMVGAQAAGGATIFGVLADHSAQVSDLFPVAGKAVAFLASMPPWIWGAIAIAGVGWIAWARWSDHRGGVR